MFCIFLFYCPGRDRSRNPRKFGWHETLVHFIFPSAERTVQHSVGAFLRPDLQLAARGGSQAPYTSRKTSAKSPRKPSCENAGSQICRFSSRSSLLAPGEELPAEMAIDR